MKRYLSFFLGLAYCFLHVCWSVVTAQPVLDRTTLVARGQQLYEVAVARMRAYARRALANPYVHSAGPVATC